MSNGQTQTFTTEELFGVVKPDTVSLQIDQPQQQTFSTEQLFGEIQPQEKPADELTFDDSFFDLPASTVIPPTVVNIPPTISIRELMRASEVPLGVNEVMPEVIRKGIKRGFGFFDKLFSDDGQSPQEILKFLAQAPKTALGELVSATKKVPKAGSFFGEITAGEPVSEEDRWGFLPEVLEDIGVPEGMEVIPQGVPIIGGTSLRGLIGFIGEIALPSIPGISFISKIGKVSKATKTTKALSDAADAIKTANKTGKISSAGEETIKKAINIVDEELSEAATRGVSKVKKTEDVEFQQKLSDTVEKVKPESKIEGIRVRRIASDIPSGESLRGGVYYNLDKGVTTGYEKSRIGKLERKTVFPKNPMIVDMRKTPSAGGAVIREIKGERFFNELELFDEAESVPLMKEAGLTEKEIERLVKIVEKTKRSGIMEDAIGSSFARNRGHDYIIGEAERGIEEIVEINNPIISKLTSTQQEQVDQIAVFTGGNKEKVAEIVLGNNVERNIDEIIQTQIPAKVEHGVPLDLAYNQVIRSVEQNTGIKVDTNKLNIPIEVKESLKQPEEAIKSVGNRIKFADKGTASPEDAGEIIPKTNNKIISKQRHLFSLLKSRQIAKEDLELALRDGFNINDFKFTGDKAMTESQIDAIIGRLKKVNKEWTDEEKLYYMVNGQEPPNVGNGAGIMLAEEGPFDSKSKRIFRGFQLSWIQTMETTLRKFGRVGDEVAERALNSYQEAAAGTAKDIKVIDLIFDNLNSQELQLFVKSYGDPTILASVPRKILDARTVFDNLTSRYSASAQSLLIKTLTKSGKKVPFMPKHNYFPHVFDMNFLSTNAKRDKVIRGLMKHKNISRGEARQELNDMMRFYRKHRAEPNLEYERIFNAPGWLGDPASFGSLSNSAYRKNVKYGLYKYVGGVNRRFAEAKYFEEGGKSVFGKDFKTIEKLIQTEPDDNIVRILTDAVNKIRGIDNSLIFERDALRILRNYQIIRRLGLAWFPNFFQPAITVLPKAQQLGFIRSFGVMGQGLTDTLRGGGRLFAKDVGAISQQTLQDITGLSSRGVSGKAATVFMKYITPFEFTENLNNILAANVGRRYFQAATKIISGEISPIWLKGKKIKQAEIDLKQLGLASSEIKKLKDTGSSAFIKQGSIDRASWRFARMTQFRATPLDLPFYASSPYGKVMFQFKNFSINIGKFGWQQIVKPAFTRGNILPLATFLGAAAGVGEIHGSMRSFISGRERTDWNENFVKRIFENIWWAGSFGMFFDMYSAIMSNRGLETILGPTFGGTLLETFDFLRKIPKAIEEDELPELLKKTAVKQIPIVGQIPELEKELTGE